MFCLGLTGGSCAGNEVTLWPWAMEWIAQLLFNHNETQTSVEKKAMRIEPCRAQIHIFAFQHKMFSIPGYTSVHYHYDMEGTHMSDFAINAEALAFGRESESLHFIYIDKHCVLNFVLNLYHA